MATTVSTGTGAGQHAVLPAETLEALAEDLEEARVGVEDGDAQGRGRSFGGRTLLIPVGGSGSRHRGRV